MVSSDRSFEAGPQLGFDTGNQGLELEEAGPGKLRQIPHPWDMGKVKEDEKDNDLRKVAAQPAAAKK